MAKRMVRINELEPKDAKKKRLKKEKQALEIDSEFYNQTIHIVASFNDWLPW